VKDLTGHTVIPGLIGMHDHTFYTTIGRYVQLAFSDPRLYLGSGVTTIRTTRGARDCSRRARASSDSPSFEERRAIAKRPRVMVLARVIRV
jgi:imidazolonepropionase-like amidohydrolase